MKGLGVVIEKASCCELAIDLEPGLDISWFRINTRAVSLSSIIRCTIVKSLRQWCSIRRHWGPHAGREVIEDASASGTVINFKDIEKICSCGLLVEVLLHHVTEVHVEEHLKVVGTCFNCGQVWQLLQGLVVQVLLYGRGRPQPVGAVVAVGKLTMTCSRGAFEMSWHITKIHMETRQVWKWFRFISNCERKVIIKPHGCQ